MIKANAWFKASVISTSFDTTHIRVSSTLTVVSTTYHYLALLSVSMSISRCIA